MLSKIRQLFFKREVSAEDTSPEGIMAAVLQADPLIAINTEAGFERLTEEQLYNKEREELADIMVSNDATASLTVNIYVTLLLLDARLTCEDPRGQAVIDEFLMTLKKKRNAFSEFLQRVVMSIVTRGNIFTEVVFDDKMMPSNLFCYDTKWAEWRKVKDKIDGSVWKLGQNPAGKDWQEITSPNVFFYSITPLMGEKKGLGMMDTGFPSLISASLMLKDLRSVVANHAFIQRYIEIKTLEMKKAGLSTTEIQTQTASLKAQIAAEWGNLKPGDTPFSSDIAEMKELQGGGARGVSFADTTDRTLDRRSLRGTKLPPSYAGSNEFVAETSAREQSVNFSIRLGTLQDLIVEVVEDGFTPVLRSQGVAADPEFHLKKSNAIEREDEAEIFNILMQGISAAVSAGFDIDDALDIYTELSGESLSEELRERIRKNVRQQTGNGPPDPEPSRVP